MWLLTLFFLAFSESSEMLLYTTHHLALPLLRRMGVHVECHRCRGVTQHVLQRFYVRADGDRNGGQGVPQVVGTQIRTPNFFGNSLEVLVKSHGDYVATKVVCKDQIPLVIPQFAGQLRIFLLPLFLVCQAGYRILRQVNCALLFRFCRIFDEVCAALLAVLLELLLNSNALAFEVHLVPRESKTLALAYTGEKAKSVSVFELRVRFDGLQKCRNFIVKQRSNFMFFTLFNV